MNDIPVTGLMYDSDENPSHSHILYITSWNGRPVHTHQFKGVTSFDEEHKHSIRGVTGPAVAVSGGGHFHEFSKHHQIIGKGRDC